MTGPAGHVRAVGDFREMPAWTVTQDSWWPADHEVVRAHPEWFDLPKKPARAKPPEPPVEQATAAPGEKRTTRRG